MGHKFFISYSRSVRSEVKDLVNFLRVEGNDVWWDADISPGQPWWGTIVDKIISSDIFIFVVSEKAVQSPYCLAEVKFATDRNRPILPFIIDAPATYSIPPQVTPKLNQWLSYNGDMDSTSREILRASSRLGIHHDVNAPRPPEPGKEHTTLSRQFQHAVDLAEDRHFEEALKHFREIESVDRKKWGDDCLLWITKITSYCEIAEWAGHKATLKKARLQWPTYVEIYTEEDGLFDPLEVKNVMSLQSLTDMTVKDYLERAKSRPANDLNGKIADYDEVIRRDPLNPDTYILRGQHYHAKKNYEAAIANFSEAVRLKPEDAYYHAVRGDTYRAKGDFKLAIADYDTSLKIKSTSFFASDVRKDRQKAIDALNAIDDKR